MDSTATANRATAGGRGGGEGGKAGKTGKKLRGFHFCPVLRTRFAVINETGNLTATATATSSCGPKPL